MNIHDTLHAVHMQQMYDTPTRSPHTGGGEHGGRGDWKVVLATVVGILGVLGIMGYFMYTSLLDTRQQVELNSQAKNVLVDTMNDAAGEDHSAWREITEHHVANFNYMYAGHPITMSSEVTEESITITAEGWEKSASATGAPRQ